MYFVLRALILVSHLVLLLVTAHDEGPFRHFHKAEHGIERQIPTLCVEAGIPQPSKRVPDSGPLDRAQGARFEELGQAMADALSQISAQVLVLRPVQPDLEQYVAGQPRFEPRPFTATSLFGAQFSHESQGLVDVATEIDQLTRGQQHGLPPERGLREQFRSGLGKLAL